MLHSFHLILACHNQQKYRFYEKIKIRFSMFLSSSRSRGTSYSEKVYISYFLQGSAYFRCQFQIRRKKLSGVHGTNLDRQIFYKFQLFQLPGNMYFSCFSFFFLIFMVFYIIFMITPGPPGPPETKIGPRIKIPVRCRFFIRGLFFPGRPGGPEVIMKIM